MGTPRKEASASSPARVVGNASILIAALIAILAGLASAAGTATLGLVFVGAGGLFLAGATLRLLGERWSTTTPQHSRRAHRAAMILAAIGALALIPAVYGAGTAYGAAWLEWDPVHSTTVYVERPGGFLVILVSLTLCAALALFALATALLLTVRAITRGRRRRQASHLRGEADMSGIQTR